MAWKGAMVWNILLFGIAVVVLLLVASGELGKPVYASNLAQILAPRLGVSEARLREELEETVFFRLQDLYIMTRIVPLCILTVLLAVRLGLEGRAACSVKRDVSK